MKSKKQNVKRKMHTKFKAIISLMLIVIFSISGIMCVNAATISDDGEYSLVLKIGTDNATIDGEYAKLIRFNADKSETTVSLSELTEGIIPFDGEHKFSHWGRNYIDDTKADDELPLSDFTTTGDFYNSDGSVVQYTNALCLYAKFSNEPLKNTGTYYLNLDAFGGKINGSPSLLLTSKSDEFQTIDLTKYVPTRKDCEFKGWDLNGKLVNTVTASDFAENDGLTVTATYTCDNFDEDYISVTLDANGGTIDGNSSKKYNYLGGGNSGTSMSLLPYVPVRKGYTFTGWNTKKDGSGKYYKYLYWRMWDKNNNVDFDRDTLVNLDGYERYMNVNLYATWSKDSSSPSDETVKIIQSEGKTKASIEFENGVDSSYKLVINEVELTKNLADKNIKYIADINIMNGNEIVEINNVKMKIRIALPDELKGYDNYNIVYILNDEIKEIIPATIEDGYIVFETNHLSQYGITAYNNPTNESQENTNKNNNTKSDANNKTTSDENSNKTTSPKTGNNSMIILLSGILFISCGTIIELTVLNKRRRNKMMK